MVHVQLESMESKNSGLRRENKFKKKGVISLFIGVK